MECTRGAAREYRDPLSGSRFFSASQILKVADADYLNGVHYQTLELARQRGVDLHKYFFYALATHAQFAKGVPKNLALGWEGYQEAIWKFIREWEPIPLLLEEASRDPNRAIAGRPDAKLKARKKTILFDLKTGTPVRTHLLQANIYRRFEEYADCEEMRTLYIRSDGTYDCPRVYRDLRAEAVVENALQILTWRETT